VSSASKPGIEGEGEKAALICRGNGIAEWRQPSMGRCWHALGVAVAASSGESEEAGAIIHVMVKGEHIK